MEGGDGSGVRGGTQDSPVCFLWWFRGRPDGTVPPPPGFQNRGGEQACLVPLISDLGAVGTAVQPGFCSCLAGRGTHRQTRVSRGFYITLVWKQGQGDTIEASGVPYQAQPLRVCFPRYRVVVSYPPQSEAEIELKEGDVVFVHKKREDGWYKGTLQRNGRTGLFPGSFVESF